MMSEDLQKRKTRIFPGRGLKEKAINEAREMFVTGEFRREFFMVAVYALLLVFLTLFSGRTIGMEGGDIINIAYIFALMGAYFILDDFLRRKKLISQPVLFFIDALFYTTLITALTIMTGGYDSPVRLPLFFLTVIPAALFGTLPQLLFFQSVVILLQVLLHLVYHGTDASIMIAVLEGMILMATSVTVKNALTMYQEKAVDFEKLSQNQLELYKEAQEYNARLEMMVEEKTGNLTKLLTQAESERKNSERQRIATINILEDMSETQSNLQDSKKSLEAKQGELSAIAELSTRLTQAVDVDQVADIVNEYLNKFIDFSAITVLTRDLEGRGGFVLKSEINKAVSRKLLDLAKKEMAGFMMNYKAISDQEYHEIIEAEVRINKGELADNDNPQGYTNFILPFKTGERILGAIHVASHNPDAYKEKEKKNIVDAIISTASVALASLEQLYLSQQSKTKSLVSSLSNGVIMLNKSLEVVLVNPAAGKFTGMGREGEGFSGFLASLSGENLEAKIGEALNQDKPGMIKEVKIKERFYEIYITPVKDASLDIMGVALIIHDITHYKLIDQMKSEFVSVASHQLRTPLTAIRLFIEMLLRGDVGALADPQKEYLNNIHESADRMVRLVNDLLNVTRIESNRMQISPEPTQLEELIESVVGEARPLAEIKNCTVNFKKSGRKTPLVPVDRSLFRQVVHNLVTNAIKYSSSRGKAEVSLSLKDGGYLIEVEDDGIGIPDKFKEKIFQKFSRADNAVKTETEGTGLGLYVSQKIVETFNGKLWFESKAGQGTRFFVLLPQAGMKAMAGERGLAIS